MSSRNIVIKDGVQVYSKAWHNTLIIIGCDQVYFGWMHRHALHLVNQEYNMHGWSNLGQGVVIMRLFKLGCM